MKVNVITRHAVPNYGSLLQTYATIKIFESIGCECNIIDYQRSDELKKNLGKTMLQVNEKWQKNFLKRLIFKMIQIPSYKESYSKFEKNRKSLIGNKMTKLYTSKKQLEQDLPDANVFCSGSDQLWGKIGADDFDSTYFLDFVPKEKKCISLSSSFGKEKIGNELKKNLNDLLKKYDSISVREASAKKILDSVKIDSSRVLDPTLMISESEWQKLFPKKKSKKEKYILVYQLHNSKEFNDYLKKIEKRSKLKIYRICPSFRHVFRKGKTIYIPTVEEFLQHIHNAEYVITDSFHGTIFSILFEKKFCTYLANDTNTRITNLLELFKIDNRILTDLNSYDWMNNVIDWNEVKNILKAERDNSEKWLKNAIYGKVNNITLIPNCCGCRCCEQLCPKKAINMVEDKEGFIKPEIDESKCINCGICYTRCPQIREIKKDEYKQKAYAAKNKLKEIQKNSSSGGIFSAIAECVIDQGGYVCGVIQTESKDIQHYLTNKKEDLEKFRGSKYVQSNTLSTFTETKKLLESKHLVLYSGTPCQIAALKSFLNKDYDNLITIDLICHGVPSNKLYKKYIEYLEEKYKGKIKNYSFRDKTREIWGTNSQVEVVKNNDKTRKYFIRGTIDPYYKNFLDGKTYRENCYTCKFAKKDRISDITLGDYWGIEEEHPDFLDEFGISLVLINSQKGEKIFSKIKEKITYIESDINKAARHNHNLNSATPRPTKRENIYNEIDKLSSYKYIKKRLTVKKSMKEYIKAILPPKVKKVIKKIVRR